jgi:tRNA nucleotidyltransferase (CCA-adding enzyme)
MQLTQLIPNEVLFIMNLLHNTGYDAYIVGGGVRDALLGKKPKDWDITTNAIPEKIIEIVEGAELKAVYENSFGTVAVIYEEEPLDSPIRTIEITPYRTESTYSDHRRPDSVAFADTIDEDLMRRDFTINALAYTPKNTVIIDLYDGQKDLAEKVVRTVGEADERFREDALRMIRAIRFATQLGFTIEESTSASIIRNHELLSYISAERIRDEFLKIIQSENPKRGIQMAHDLQILQYIVPELEEGIGCDQSRNHIYDVWEHNLNAGQNSAEQDWPLHIRLSALFHDIGKPRTRRWDKTQKLYTFYGHEVVGAKMVAKICKRLVFPKDLCEKLYKLVRYHMFFSDTDLITHSAVRRMVRNVGPDLVWDLMKVRRSDRKGMGRPKADPYRLRMYESMIEEVMRDPISVGMLKIDGDYMINTMKMTPGRRMGWMLHALLEEVLDDPTRNTLEWLQERTLDLAELDDKTLQSLGEKGRDKKTELEEQEIKKLRKSHKVDFKK